MASRKTNKITDTHNGLISTLTAQDFNIQDAPKELDPKSFSLWIRQLLQGWRQGTVGCKGRADVNYANRKPWKQKGTGRARAGSAKSPLWRGGGVIFGPQPRTRTLKVAKQLKKGVLANLFWHYLQQGKIHSLDWALADERPKTTVAYQVLKDARIGHNKINVLLPNHDALHYSSFANIDNVNIVFFDEINAYDLVLNDCWVVLKKDVDAFKEVVAQWI
jgi:large subunit ribosomal protein L4